MIVSDGLEMILGIHSLLEKWDLGIGEDEAMVRRL